MWSLSRVSHHLLALLTALITLTPMQALSEEQGSPAHGDGPIIEVVVVGCRWAESVREDVRVDLVHAQVLTAPELLW